MPTDGRANGRLFLCSAEVISWYPRVTVFDNFLSPRECSLLVSFARKGLHPSSVVDTLTGEPLKDEWRTSSGYFLAPEEEQHAAVEDINERIALASQTPAENGEPMQVRAEARDG